MNVAKKAWYYEEPEENATTWKNGKLYWIIEVNGSAIKKDTEIKDAISCDNGLTDSFIHEKEDSIAGIYKGNLGEIKEYSSFEKFAQNAESSKQDIDSLFTLKYERNKSGFSDDNYNNLIFKAKEDIVLGENQTLYIIVRTEPQSLPDQYRKPYTYRNEVYKTEPGENETKIGSADQKLYHGGEILKELGQVFTYDGQNVTTDSSIDGADKGEDAYKKICSDLLKDTGSGIYAAWAFKVNHGGELNSNYRVLEDIPEGMELAYIRIKWKGDKATAVTSSEITGLGSEWEKVENNTMNDDEKPQYTIYYVSNDKKQAMIQLGTFQADHIEDKGSVDVQVVCRVTDPKVLLGGEEKTFTNKVVLQSENGEEDLATATADAKIKDTNLTKENGYSTTSSNESQKVTYTIVANSRGQKLLTAEGEKLTLVDTLGEYLSFDSESLEAKNAKTEEPVKIQSSYNPEDKTIEIVIPDKTPVRITYSVTVNIAPNQKVALQNSVHWKSYSANGGTTNKIKEFSYQLSAGGSSGTTSHPNLTIKKNDQDNTSNKLNGVEFEVYECEMDNNQIQRTNKKTTATITNGTCEIATTSQFPMEFNKIYEVTETKAVDGYKEDKTPHYIMCVKQVEGDYPNTAKAYIEYCKKMKDDTRYKVAYETKNFFLEIYNEQEGIVVEKAFINDAAGKSHNPVSGTYWFGLYDNAEGSGSLLDTVSITYNPGDQDVKKAKFKNLDSKKTYYVFELDDNKQPIKASQEATINKQQYTVTYSKNAAQCGDTVTVTNQSHTKMLPTTGSCGTLLYRLAGTILMLLASLRMLLRYTKK